MESKPDLPTPTQGVIIAFRSWEKGAAHRGIPSEKDDHTFMLLHSKYKVLLSKLKFYIKDYNTQRYFWNFVHQESVPRIKFK